MVVIILFLWGSTRDDRQGKMNRNLSRNDKFKPKKQAYRGGNVDAAFMEKIQNLIKVVMPNWTCKESKYVAILTLLLVLRTQMSIWLADVNGKIVKAIVERNFQKFCYRVSNYISLYDTFFYRFST
jgi:hypothetical protein